MQRRRVLALTTAASTGSIPLGAVAGASRRIKVLDTYLSNADQFPDGRWPTTGSRLDLRRAPLRACDTRAFAVLDPSCAPLGYVPPASTKVLAALMDGTVTEATAARPAG